MRKFVDWLFEWLPTVWAIAWVVIITLASFGGVIWSIQWVFDLLGVM